MSNSPFPDVEAHIIDTNLFITFERHDTVDLLERAVREHDIVLFLPSRVYEELTPENYPYGTPPVEEALAAGWVKILDEVDYTNPVISATMDMVRRYIAAADDRAEHDIEQADAEVGGSTAMLLERGDADSVAVYTHDLPAFRGVERAMSKLPHPTPSAHTRLGP